MNPYTPNRTCQCPRCRARGLMGPAILITLGTLFLLDEMWVIRWAQTFPILLIVIGVMLYLGRTASIEGHVEPGVTRITTASSSSSSSSMPPPAPGSGTPSHGPEVNS